MKKIIFAFAVILIVALTYYMNNSESGSTVGSDSADKGFSLRNSFKNILPGGEKTPESKGRLEGDHVVVINSKPVHIEADEVVERIESQKDLKDNEAIDFARWTLFSEHAKYTTEEKEIIFDRSLELLNSSQASLLSRDVLLNGNLPDLMEKALSFQSQNLSKADLENLIREILHKRTEPEIRSAVIDFAATKNIYVK